MRRSALAILFITVVIDLLGFGIIFPLLPLYVKHFGGSPLVAGWMATTYSVMQFVFAPVWGRASDRWGRRPLILLGLAGSALAFLVYGLATHLWMLFAARIAAGVLTAASLPAAQAYIADVLPPEKRSRGMALIGAAFGVGFALGPWLGGWLGRYGLAVPAFVVAGLSAANFAWSYFALPESRKPGAEAGAHEGVAGEVRRLARALRTPSLGPLLTVFGVATFAFALMEATYSWLVLLRFVEPAHAGAALAPGVLEARAAATVGPLMGVVGITVVLAQGAVMAGLAQRVGERQLVWVGSLMLTASLAGIGGAGSLASMAAWSALLAAGEGLLNPSLSSLVSQAAREDERGGMMGLQHGLGSLARIVGPPVGTWMLQRYTTAAPYYAAAALMAVAFALSLRLRASAPLPAAESH